MLLSDIEEELAALFTEEMLSDGLTQEEIAMIQAQYNEIIGDQELS